MRLSPGSQFPICSIVTFIKQRPVRIKAIVSLMITIGVFVGLCVAGVGLGWYISDQHRLIGIGSMRSRHVLYKWQRELLRLKALLYGSSCPADTFQLQIDLVHSRAQITQRQHLATNLPASELIDSHSRQTLDELYAHWLAIERNLGDWEAWPDGATRQQVIGQLAQIELELNLVIREQENQWAVLHANIVQSQSGMFTIIWVGLSLFVILLGLTVFYVFRFQAERRQLLVDLNQTNHDLVEANHTLANIATIDELTQIANRRHFNATIHRTWQQLSQEQVVLSVILADVDHFKAYNDHYGHQGGDECLKQVAQALQDSVCRSRDLVARYGGEEFIVLLPHTHSEGAVQVIQRIQAQVEQLNIAHAASPTSDRVTLCFGIATTVPQATASYETLIQQADLALYEAKDQGRNGYQVAYPHQMSLPSSQSSE
ncbi:MAG: GGDEF domain-containing protein [Leptolyngbyaceae cyanobacterium]